jgi:hypothetical protein
MITAIKPTKKVISIEEADVYSGGFIFSLVATTLGLTISGAVARVGVGLGVKAAADGS